MTASATTDLTAYDAMLKDYYQEDKLIEQSFADNPFFAMVPKRMKGGKRFIQPIEYGNPGGASAGFGQAMAGATRSSFGDFIGTTSKQYQRVLVDHETLLSSESPDEAFQPAFDEFDRGFRSLGEKMAHRLYRTKGGNIGQLANTSVSGTSVITLADAADAFNFQIGQQLQFSTTDGTGSLLAGGAYVSVTTIDRENGLIGTDASVDLVTSISGLTTTSYVFPAGDYNACLPGLADWLPTDRSTAGGHPLSTPFFNITRSTDADRLGGLYMDGTTLGGIDEILIKGVAKVAKHGGRTTHIFMNPETGADLQLLSSSKMFAMQTFTQKVSVDGQVLNIGFAGIQVIVGGQIVQIFLDRNCQSNRIWFLNLPSWTLWHKGPLPGFLGEKWTGQILKIAETEDSLEGRVGCYTWLACKAPAHNLVATVPTA